MSHCYFGQKYDNDNDDDGDDDDDDGDGGGDGGGDEIGKWEREYFRWF